MYCDNIISENLFNLWQKKFVEISVIRGKQKKPVLPKKKYWLLTNQIKSILKELRLFCEL